MIYRSRPWHLLLALVMLSCCLVLAAPPASARVTCNIPRALLCEGCARDLTITLRGGRCHVGFNASEPTSASRDSGSLTVHVDHAPPDGLKPRKPRKSRVAARQSAPAERCFIFNGRRFCE